MKEGGNKAKQNKQSMMRFFLVGIVSFFLLIQCKAQDNGAKSTDDGLVEFQIYGELAPDGYLDAADTITHAYGFKLKRVSGCEMGSGEAKRINKQNLKGLEEMNEKYGKDWRAKFTEKTGYHLAIPFN